MEGSLRSFGSRTSRRRRNECRVGQCRETHHERRWPHNGGFRGINPPYPNWNIPMPRNLVVAQSGGPSPVINNSLKGIVEAAREFSQIGTVYGGWHGIEGILTEDLLDLSEQD